MRIEANGISMNYELSGRGRCLTLIHGGGDNLNAWYNQVPVFSQHYRVLTYDVRGHGQTELPEGELTMELWGDDLYALLTALNISETILLGHSMGGDIARQLTLTHPEMVKALILSNSGLRLEPASGEEMREMQTRRQAQIEVIKREGMEGAFKDIFIPLFSPGFAEKNPETMERYRAILLQTDPEGYLQVMQRMRHPSTSLDLSKITCPTLIIAGEYDPFSGPAAYKATHEAIRGSQLEVFPTGHIPAMECPQEYNEAVLRFLDEVGLG